MTNSVEQSPYGVDSSRSASQEILSSFTIPDVNYLCHKSPPLDPILSHINAVHILKPNFFITNFNIILS
jgi:hypothetical protein